MALESWKMKMIFIYIYFGFPFFPIPQFGLKLIWLLKIFIRLKKKSKEHYSSIITTKYEGVVFHGSKCITMDWTLIISDTMKTVKPRRVKFASATKIYCVESNTLISFYTSLNIRFCYSKQKSHLIQNFHFNWWREWDCYFWFVLINTTWCNKHLQYLLSEI